MLFLPEQKIKALVDYALDNIDESYLYRLYGDQAFGDQSYSYFENARALFLKRQDNPRKVECNVFFNKDRQGLPTIHIAMNSESFSGDNNGLGFDPGEEFNSMMGCRDVQETFTRSYSSRYNIIFTSDNTFEVLLMYNTIKAFFQGNYPLLELNGLQNVKFSGNDIILTDYLAPPNIYSRAFMIDCIYEFTAPSLRLLKDQMMSDSEVKVVSSCGHEISINDEKTC